MRIKHSWRAVVTSGPVAHFVCLLMTLAQIPYCDLLEETMCFSDRYIIDDKAKQHKFFVLHINHFHTT